MQLVAKIVGEIQESNFPEFKKQMLRQIEGADRKLETEADFIAAVETVKLCKTTEQDINACQKEMIEGTADIAELAAGLSDLSGALAKTRKSLSGQISKRREIRILNMITAGIDKIDEYRTRLLTDLPEIKNFPRSDRGKIQDRIKGRSNMDNMQKIIQEETQEQIAAMDILGKTIIENEKTIHAAGKASLFPDMNVLLTAAPAMIRVTVESRLAKFELEEQKQSEAKRQEEARLADKKRREEKQQSEAKRQEETMVVAAKKETETKPLPETFPDTDWSGEEKSPTEKAFNAQPARPAKAQYSLIVAIYGTPTEAKEIARDVDAVIAHYDAVTAVELTKNV